MLRYFFILAFLIGCKKSQTAVDEPVPQFVYPTCEENPLFCDDEEFDDLPEADDQNKGNAGGEP